MKDKVTDKVTVEDLKESMDNLGKTFKATAAIIKSLIERIEKMEVDLSLHKKNFHRDEKPITWYLPASRIAEAIGKRKITITRTAEKENWPYIEKKIQGGTSKCYKFDTLPPYLFSS